MGRTVTILHFYIFYFSFIHGTPSFKRVLQASCFYQKKNVFCWVCRQCCTAFSQNPCQFHMQFYQQVFFGRTASRSLLQYFPSFVNFSLHHAVVDCFSYLISPVVTLRDLENHSQFSISLVNCFNLSKLFISLCHRYFK